MGKHITGLWILSLTNLLWIPCDLFAQRTLRQATGPNLDAMGAVGKRYSSRSHCFLHVGSARLWPAVFVGAVVAFEAPNDRDDPHRPESGHDRVGGFAACIAAPLFEELHISIISARLATKCVAALATAAGHRTAAARELDAESRVCVAAKSDRLSGGGDLRRKFVGTSNHERKNGPEQSHEINPYEAPAYLADASNSTDISLGNRLIEQKKALRLPRWPILVSSIIFALLHYQHGPDWIPLFLLAIGLGYLYHAHSDWFRRWWFMDC